MTTIIFSSGRCGTNLIIKSFREIYGDRIRGELFHPLVGVMMGEWGFDDMLKGAHFHSLYVQHHTFDKRYVDHCLSESDLFKINYHQYIPLSDNTKRYIESQPINYIHLIRNSYLSYFLSLKIAERDNRWWLYDNVDSVSPIDISVEEFVKNCKRIDDSRSYIRSSFGDKIKLEISYEELCSDWDDSYKKIQDVAGLEVKEIPQKTRRILQRPVEEYISNYEEFESYLKGTEYYKYLEGSN